MNLWMNVGMKRTRIDFAPPGWRRTLFRAPPRLVFVAPAIVALLAVVALLGEGYLERRDELAALQAAIAARGKAAAPVVARPVEKIAVAPAQATAVNDAIMQLNLPWRDLLEAVRDATPASVALLALEPDAKRRLVRITAEARSSDDMLDYVARMQAEEWFSSVVLTRHEVMLQDPNRPLRFQVSAQWAESAPSATNPATTRETARETARGTAGGAP